MNTLRRILIFSTFVIISFSSYAWGGLGHSTIAYLAEQHLTPEAKAQCHKYLHHTLAFYASWMDDWRNSPGFEDTSHWHTAVVDKNFRYIKDEPHNAAYQVVRIEKRMKKYRKMKDSLVCDNLKYLIHMVGDMHCPSHTTFRFNPEYKNYTVLIKNKPTNVHTFWDASPGYCHPKKKADELAREIDVYSPEEIEEFCKGTVDDWAHDNALESRARITLVEKGAITDQLSEEERAGIRKLSDLQLAKAGYRLAAVLNRIFAK